MLLKMMNSFATRLLRLPIRLRPSAEGLILSGWSRNDIFTFVIGRKNKKPLASTWDKGFHVSYSTIPPPFSAEVLLPGYGVLAFSIHPDIIGLRAGSQQAGLCRFYTELAIRYSRFSIGTTR